MHHSTQRSQPISMRERGLFSVIEASLCKSGC